MKYKINQKKNSNTGEFYCNKGTDIITANAAYAVTVTDADGNRYDLSACYLGKRQYTGRDTITTRIRDNKANRMIYEVFDASGFLISSQVLDNNLDTILSADANITTKYERNNDLVKSETISKTVDLSDPEDEPDTPAAPLFTRTTNYDDYPDSVIVADEFGNETQYTFDSTWGVVKSVTLPDATVVTDFYDSDMCAKLKRTFGSSAGRSISYDYAGGNLASLQTGSLGYTFGYTKGDLTSVSKNSVSIEEHTHTTTQTDSYYPSQASKLHSTSAVFDKYGRLTSIAGVLTNTYDLWPSLNSSVGVDNGSSLLATTTDEMRSEISKFAYTAKGQLSSKTIVQEANPASEISQETFVYDDFNRMTGDTFVYNKATGKQVASAVEYVPSEDNPANDSRVKKYTYTTSNANAATTVNTFDILKRVVSKQHTVSGKVFARNFTYSNSRVIRHADTFGGANLGTNNYGYDAMGRIRTDSYSCAYASGDYRTYEYDEYGQLVRENNQGLAKTFVYEYNDIGNLTAIKAYPFTLSTTPSATPVTTTFGYTDDKLTSFGGSTIAYNTMGCPARYDDKFVVWSKGKLSRFTSGNFTNGTSSYGYEYNAFGQRVSKDYSYTEGTSGLNPVQTGQVTAYTKNYHYDHAGRLIAESSTKTLHGQGTSNESIVFLYDESGIIGMELTTGGTANLYYFQRNLQGDVVAIYDTNGALKAKYLYDAWGNCTISSETTNYDVANANPIRYRGYYYDDDTGLYYCNARYYSPKWRRFISPDDTAYLNPENVNGLNLYCYCNNDPVNFTDPSGCAAILITLGIMAIGGLIGTVVSATTSAFVQLAINGEINWKSVGIAAASGFVSGAIAASPFGLGVQIFAGGIIGGVSYIADCYVNNTEITLDGAVVSVLMGIASGAIGGPGANKNNTLTNSVLQFRRTLAREARRANQVYAQKAIASITSYIHNILAVTTWGSSIKFSAGCGVASAITTIYANNRIFSSLPSWNPWE